MLYFYDACMVGLLACMTVSCMKDEVFSTRVYWWICVLFPFFFTSVGVVLNNFLCFLMLDTAGNLIDSTSQLVIVQ